MKNTNPDIKRMKQEAIKYVNDMKAKSKFNYSNSSNKIPHSNNTTSNNFDKENSNVRKDKYDKPQNKKDAISDILDIIMKDKEKTIILALILILMNEGADTSLILALMYLLI